MRSVLCIRSSKHAMLEENGGNETGRSGISKISGKLSWPAVRIGRRRKGASTKTIFPATRSGRTACSGFHRGSMLSRRRAPAPGCLAVESCSTDDSGRNAAPRSRMAPAIAKDSIAEEGSVTARIRNCGATPGRDSPEKFLAAGSLDNDFALPG